MDKDVKREIQKAAFDYSTSCYGECPEGNDPYTADDMFDVCEKCQHNKDCNCQIYGEAVTYFMGAIWMKDVLSKTASDLITLKAIRDNKDE